MKDEEAQSTGTPLYLPGVISLLLCFALLASIAFVDAGKKKQRPYPITQKVIILQAGPSATYPWVGHCPPKGKCKKFYKVARPPFPSFLPPAPRLPYYAPAQYAPAQYAPAQYAPAQYAPAQYAPAPYTEPVYSQPAPVYSAPAEPVYSAPAPVYSQPDETVYSAPATVYVSSAEEFSAAPAHVDTPAPELNAEPIIPSYSQSETVPDLSSNFAIQEVSAPDFNYGSGSSDIGSSESQSYGDVAAAASPTYAPEAPAVIAEVETVVAEEPVYAPAEEPVYAPAEEPVYVPAEPTSYSGSSSGEIQQEFAQSTYAQEPALETVQQIDSVQAVPELTEFFNDPIYQEDLGDIFQEPAQPSEPEVYQPAEEEAENYGERIRPRGGRR
uniref:Uncharacterized protein n=1 Tax=Daphnia galeata TaxID=27404 RepID=A0A8J2RPG0_9CRUS|nr:unnamed protein product [Daphnia galeata]